MNTPNRPDVGEALQLLPALQSMRDRMMAALPPKFGDGFDGDMDTLLETINAIKRLARLSPPAPGGDAVRALVDEWADDDTPILRGEAAAELREALKQSAPGTDVIRDMRLLAAVGIPVAPECVAQWAESLAARCGGAPGVETVTDACLHTLRKTAALPVNAGWIAAVTPQDARAILASLTDAQVQTDEESAYVIEQMGRLLAQIAVIVKGPEPALTQWSYHDLPKLVAQLKQRTHRAPCCGVAEGELHSNDCAAAPAPAVEREAVLSKLREWLGTDGTLYREVAALLVEAPPAEAREPVGVTDADVERARFARMQKIADMREDHKAGRTTDERVQAAAMRAALESFAAQPRDTPRDSGDAEDAKRWRALIGTGRVRYLGSAGLHTDTDPYGNPWNGYAHIGLELWTKHDAPNDPEAVRLLTKYADIAAMQSLTGEPT